MVNISGPMPLLLPSFWFWFLSSNIWYAMGCYQRLGKALCVLAYHLVLLSLTKEHAQEDKIQWCRAVSLVILANTILVQPTVSHILNVWLISDQRNRVALPITPDVWQINACFCMLLRYCGYLLYSTGVAIAY